MKQDYQIVERILLTEKGTRLSEAENKFVFRVHPNANKHEIAGAVERLFKVKVDGVNTLNQRGKKKRQRTANFGRTAHWKKAIVTLAEGSTIDLT